MNQIIKIAETLESLLEGHDLNQRQAKDLMKAWLNNEISPVQTGAFLAALRTKRSTGLELSSMAKELLNACKIPIDRPDLYLVDTCGTGGDGANTFNISTAVAFVASSCGVVVSKHGNRSASGKVGSADVLSNLGLNLNCSLEKVILALKEIGITFLFAPAWHKSLVNLAPLRKELGVRTIFNQLGPLVNPLRPNAQVLGVASDDLLQPMASALNELGMKRAVVVYGYGGLDEASLEGDNKVIFLDKGNLKSSILNVSEFNIENISNKELVVNANISNEEILKSVLQGLGATSHINVVALNTSLVLWAAGLENNIEMGFKKALDNIYSGKPWEIFINLKNFLDE